MLDKVRAVKDVTASILAGLTTWGVTAVDDASQATIVGVVGGIVTLALTFFGGGNKVEQ